MKMKVLLVSLGLVCAGLASAAQVTPTAEKPNIIVILMDDMGYSDFSSYGGEIPTPNIDQLASEGLRFSQFYNSARCSPSRASLLTGLYPHQAGMGYLATGDVKPDSKGTQGIIHDRAVTMAEVLNRSGYFTAMTGKWHLGFDRGITPWSEGFQRSLNLPHGAIYFPNQIQYQEAPEKYTLYYNSKPIANDDPVLGKKDWYGTDLWTDMGIRFIEEAREQKKPFFLYLSHIAPHFPIMAPQEEIDKFRGQYMAGWNKLREARYQRQIEMGLIDKSWPLTKALPEINDWDKLPEKKKQRFDEMMAVYAASITKVDQNVGKLVAYLKETKQLDNTLLLILSDNGGNAEGGPEGRSGNKPLGGPDSNVFVGMNWAMLQNTPFLYFKHFTHEGGVATPLIAHWPKGIAKQLNGRIDHTPGHLVDIMATAVDLSNASYPTTFNGHEILPMEGVSLNGLFKGQPLQRGKPIFFEHEGNRAVRDGKWKVISRGYGPWELYDMEADRTETKNLAVNYPEQVQIMVAQYTDWAKNSYVDELFKEPRTNWGAPKKK